MTKLGYPIRFAVLIGAETAYILGRGVGSIGETFAVAAGAVALGYGLAYAVRAKPRAGIAVLAAVIVAGIAAIAIVIAKLPGPRGPVPYVEAAELAKHPQDYLHRTIKVRGTVVAGSVYEKIADQRRTVRFQLEGGIAATYTGVLPDAFRERAMVMVTGELTSPTQIDATDVTAKCPERYDSGSGAKLHY